MKTTAHPVMYCMLATIVMACEGLAGGKGLLLEKGSAAPVGNAQLVLFVDNQPVDTAYSDSAGFFTVQKTFRPTFRQPDSRLVIIKPGFRPDTVHVTNLWLKDPDFDKEDMRIYLEVDSI